MIAEILRREGIATDPARLEERIEAAAVGYSDPDDAARQIRANDNLRTQIESAVLEDQAVDWLLGKVKIVDEPTTFKDLMNFGA